MGRDKSQLPWRGHSLLTHIAQRLSPQVAKLLISRGYQSPLQDNDTLTDAQPQLGPLGGIQAALQWMAQQADPNSLLVSCSCDSPEIPEDLAQHLLNAAATSPALAYYSQYQGRSHYAHSLWRLDCLPPLNQYLAQVGRAMGGFLQACQALPVVYPEQPQQNPFLNLNTLNDYTAYHLGEQPHGG